MPHVYIISDAGSTSIMDRHRCTDEKRELQDLIEKNPDLIPGDQIEPDEPCRWILIKREMPVPDPATGKDRWSIDFLLADQSAIPTFVECKRFEDTRSRREVIGQVLEYAANGPDYWTREQLRRYAEQAAVAKGSSLEDSFAALGSGEFESVDNLFETFETNLKTGQVRIIFVLEEAPNELKCLVEFLNNQLVSTDVLLVELRQYVRDGLKVLVPMLFGFTEQARRIKQTIKVNQRESRKWDWDAFKTDAREKGLSEADITAMSQLKAALESLGANIHWGGGKETGSYSAKWPRICSGAIVSVYSTGDLVVCFGNLTNSELARSVRQQLKEALVRDFGLRVPADFEKRFPQYPVSLWGKRVDGVVQAIRQSVSS
jgi:hypothetical protein